MKNPILLLQRSVFAILLHLFLNLPALADYTPSPQDPPLTPQQQAFMNTYVACLQDYKNQNLPRSQVHVFVRTCLSDHGYDKPVDMKPQQSVQQ